MEKANDKRKWIIYMYTFPNGKRYIGKTCRTLKDRQDGSKWRGYNKCPALWNAIQKYGIENIQQDVLFESYMADEYSDRLEMLCIALFKTNCVRYKNPSYGYNCDDGGKGTPFHTLSDESRKKISNARKGKFLGEDNPFYGKTHSDETKEKLSKIHKNKIIPNEVKQKMSKSHFGHTPTNNKYVYCIELDMIFCSITNASEYTKADPSSIIRCCKGLQKTSMGYHWRYATQDEIIAEKIARGIEVA